MMCGHSEINLEFVIHCTIEFVYGRFYELHCLGRQINATYNTIIGMDRICKEAK